LAYEEHKESTKGLTENSLSSKVPATYYLQEGAKKQMKKKTISRTIIT